MRTEPAGATVTVVDGNGSRVAVEQTPAVLKLARKARYFRGMRYHLVIEKEGFRTAEVNIEPTINGWYFGNILIGGLIGMLVVDPLTGSMWSLTPSKLDQVLGPESAAVLREEGGFLVILRENVPAPLVASLQPIDR